MAVRLVWLVVLALGLVGWAAAPAVAADARDLVGKYELKGSNPDGSTYEGTAEIEFEKGNTVKITYKVGKRNDIGLGKFEDGKLTVTYVGAVADRKGGAEYALRKNGRLVGSWHDKGDKPGKETLIPQK
jgi:hypothetical protein